MSRASFVTKGRIVKGDSAAALSTAAPTERGDDAELAARWLALKARENAAVESHLDQTTELAVMLAERIVGAEIEQNPAKIGQMARALWAEARGAKKALFEANPIDVEALREQTAFLGDAVAIEPNADLPRGSLVLHTDLGTVDGRLTPQLERLAAALKVALR